MNFGISDDLRLRASDARRWSETTPRGSRSRLDTDAWRGAARLGVFALAVPVACGGEGKGALDIATVLEAMGRGGADRGLLLSIGAHVFGCLLPLCRYGTADQLARWVEGLRTGAQVGALAVTEPGGGSSFETLATTAVPAGDGYQVHGHKTLICNAPAADLFLVLARQFPDRGALGLTAFMVPRHTPGLSVQPIQAAGLPGAPMGSVRLDGCPLPQDAVLGRPGAGLKVFSTAMQWERTCLLAGFLGAAERDLTACIRALAQRDQALLRNQAVSHRLAETRLRLDGARLLLQRAACTIDSGHEDHAAAAMAKFAVSEAVVACAQNVVRLLAGTGWRGEPFDAAAVLVDTLGGLFTSGTSELQLDLIARHLQAESLRD